MLNRFRRNSRSLVGAAVSGKHTKQIRAAGALLAVAISFFIAAPAWSTACTGNGIEVQVLGSGGPELLGNRASSSYLVWRGGKPSVLVDSGGGSALRFGESGAKVSDLDLVLFSHFHIDHSADFAALVKSSYFQDRNGSLPAFGPAANKAFPSTTQFLNLLFDENGGSYRYLSAYLPADGEAGKNAYALVPHDVETTENTPKQVFGSAGLKVSALSQHHGNVPALAWRVETGGVAIVFSGDTDGKHLDALAKAADLLVAHNAIPQTAQGSILDLHMPPLQIGKVAAAAKVRNLVLSHRMSRSLGQEEATRAAIAVSWKGKVEFANDLDCFAVQPQSRDR
ncbi:MAG: MBL fold metallo-hydrolase [Dokdonella sp.]